MDGAAFASLRQPVLVRLGREKITVPVATTAQWLASLQEPVPLFSLLPFDEAVRLNGLRYDHDHPLDEGMLLEAWYECLAAQSGFDWWVAVRLMDMMLGEWTAFSGMWALKGADALTQPVDLSCAAILAMLRDGMDQKDLDALERELYASPVVEVSPGKKAPAGWDDTKNAEAWLQAAAVAPTRTSNAGA